MSTPFLTALSGYIEAERAHERAMRDVDASTMDVDSTERLLAQAGDALEGELRRMMREESAISMVRLEMYGAGDP